MKTSFLECFLTLLGYIAKIVSVMVFYKEVNRGKGGCQIA